MYKLKILITGGLGFIGSKLAAVLVAHNAKVTILDNLSSQIHGAIPIVPKEIFDSNNLDVVRGDINDREALINVLNGVDLIVHLAAETGTGQSMYKIAHYNKINTLGTGVLLDVLTNVPHKVRKLILASSRSIYGEGAYFCLECREIKYPKPRTRVDLANSEWEMKCPVCNRQMKPAHTPENAPPQPASIYAATKYAQEDLVKIVCGAIGIGYTILRFQNVYGAGQSLNNPYTGILSIFSTRIRKGLNLPIFEDGLESRDFIHVSDVVRSILMSIESDQSDNEIFNVGSGIQSTIFEVAQKLLVGFQKNSEIVVTGEYRLGDIRHCFADLTHIRQRLGFTPQVSLDQGLEQFATWVLSQPLPEDNSDKANSELRARKLMR